MDANAVGRIRHAAARRLARWCARRCCPPPADERGDSSALPEDLIIIVMALMEVPDVISCAAVCSSWRSAYNTFRRLRLPTPNQQPCLLYYAAARDGEPPRPRTMTLYSPSTDVTLRLQRPSRRLRLVPGIAGSAYGWLLTTDEAANPYLLNPITGVEAALPPITKLKRSVNGGFMDADGGIGEHGWYQQQRITISAAPAAAACVVVLLVHKPYWELSFGRPGDEQWTSITHQQMSSYCIDGVACDDDMQIAAAGSDQLFYLMSGCGLVYVLDLGGPAPVVRSRTKAMGYMDPNHSYYLVLSPSGEPLLVTRHLRREFGNKWRRRFKVTTTEVYVEKMDLEARKMVRLDGIGEEYALFLGHGSPVWIPAKAVGHPLVRPNCVYLTDEQLDTHRPIMVWDFGSGRSLDKLARAWRINLHRPWPTTPIWITPSLY